VRRPGDAVTAATVFPDVHARTARELPLSDLLAVLRDPPHHPEKAACALFVAGTFGERLSEAGAIRNADNLIQISAVVGDYDADVVALDEARERLEAQGVAALLYTSPSHTLEKPRWRVVAPLGAPQSKEMLSHHSPTG
jgi:hypothetical protein